MSPFLLGVYVGFGGALIFFALSFFARNSGGYQRPLDPFGPAPLSQREWSRVGSEIQPKP